jgi:hypothetical protein
VVNLSRRQLADDRATFRTALRHGAFEELFGKAAEKDRLAACAPQTKQIHLRLIGAPARLFKNLIGFRHQNMREISSFNLSYVHRNQRNPLQCQS